MFTLSGTGVPPLSLCPRGPLGHLNDLEDLYLAEGTLDRIRGGEEHPIPLEEKPISRLDSVTPVPLG